MLRVSLDKIVNILETNTGRRVTIADISQKTQIHRNIVSRILNRPEGNSSTQHIEKLVEYFFYELRSCMKLPDEQLAAYVISNLFEFFPEQKEHRAFLKSLQKAGGVDDVPVAILWQFFSLSKGALLKPDLSPEKEREETIEVEKRLSTANRTKSKNRKTK